MASATRVYIIMLLIFALGLWTILSFGSVFLSAPMDISGQWNLYAAGESTEGEPEHKLSIDQSGWYCRVTIDGDRHTVLDVKRQTPRKPVLNVNDPIELALSGPGLEMTFSGQPARLSLRISGALDGTWTALRPDLKHAPGSGATTRPTPSHAGL